MAREVAYEPPEGWDVWLNASAMNRRRQVRLASEPPPVRKVESAPPVEAPVVRRPRRATRRKGRR